MPYGHNCYFGVVVRGAMCKAKVTGSNPHGHKARVFCMKIQPAVFKRPLQTQF
jgi:hypothetical protein